MIGAGGVNCPFCAEDTIDKSIYGDGDAYVLPPLNPVTDGHLLIIPYEHYLTFDPRGIALGMEKVGSLLKFYEPDIDLSSYNIILNGGVAASQSVEHMHWHFVPRREGDGLMLPWTNQIKES